MAVYTVLYRDPVQLYTNKNDRKYMNKKIYVCLVSCLVAADALAAHTGHVFVDKNGNGVFDKGEKTLSGVMVSDGLNVVKTDRDGAFALPGHEKERFIFITTPSGYKTYNAYYRRIEGKDGVYDFGVIPYESHVRKDGSHKFVHISDTEISGDGSVDEHQDWVQILRDYAANEDVAFIMHGGDICYESGLKKHIRLMNTANMNVPVYYSIGNHDLVKGAYGEELFESLYGPVYYSFDVGSVHYVVTPMMGGDYAPSYRPVDVYRWLENDLAQIPEGKPVVVFGHDLPTTGDQFVFPSGEGKQLDLDAYNLKAWLYGHWHITHIHKHKQAYSICSSTPIRGGIDHSLSSFRVMHMDGKGDFESELRYTYMDKAVQIASVHDGVASYTPSGKVQLLVNAYSSTSPVEKITYTIGKADEHKSFFSGKLLPQTDFSWFAEIPVASEREGQFLTMKVAVQFRNGEIAFAERSFVYQPAGISSVRLQQDCTNLLGNARHVAVDEEKREGHLQLKWVRNVGSNIYMTSPVIYKGHIYVATVDENNEGLASAACLDALTGEKRWSYPVRSSVKNTIVASMDKVVVQDVEGYCYALDAVTGRLVWEKQLPIEPVLPTLIEGLVVKDDIVYAGSGKGLCAIDVNSGKTLWQNEDWRQNQGSTATPSISNGVLVCSTHWGALYGNDIQTGKMLWKMEKEGIRHRSSSAVMQGDYFYLASGESLFLMETKTGHILQQQKFPFSVNVASSPLITRDEILFGTASEGIIALDCETWEEKWRFRTNEAMVYTAPYVRNPAATVEASPVLVGNMVIVGGADGVLYGLDKGNGTLLWKHELGAPVFASVAVSGNTLFAVDYGGNVYAFVWNAEQ